MAASFAFCFGIIKPEKIYSRAIIAIGNSPMIGFELLSNDNSSITIYDSISEDFIYSDTDKIPIARVRS